MSNPQKPNPLRTNNMNPIELTVEIMKGVREGFECCYRPDPRPFSHWENHCVNCGVHVGMAHRDNCPPQKYEKLPKTEVEGTNKE